MLLVFVGVVKAQIIKVNLFSSIMIFRVSAIARARAGVIGRRYASSEVSTQSSGGLNAFAAAWYNMYVPHLRVVVVVGYLSL